MMRCDICGDSYKPEQGRTVYAVTGRHMDASGNGYESETKEVDCCNGCVALALLAWPKVKERLETK